MTNPILAFLKEMFTRLKVKSPKFFQVIQWISIACTLITGLPAFLDYLGIVLPGFLLAIENKTIGIAGMVGIFLSGLTVNTSHLEEKATTKIKEGETNKTVDSQIREKLPFTEKFN